MLRWLAYSTCVLNIHIYLDYGSPIVTQFLILWFIHFDLDRRSVTLGSRRQSCYSQTIHQVTRSRPDPQAMDQHVAKKEAAIAALDNEITSDSSEQEVGLRDRLRQYVTRQYHTHDSEQFLINIHSFTFAQFLLPLSTGVIALLLAATPHRFDGLETIGKIFFIFALVMFVLCICSITTRFMLFPGSFRCSIQHPTESLFAPTLLLTGE